jgi:hypothetical protein
MKLTLVLALIFFGAMSFYAGITADERAGAFSVGVGAVMLAGAWLGYRKWLQ